MNKKLRSAFTLLFCAACSLCIITDVIFPYLIYFIKGLIIIGVIALVWTSILDINRYCKAFNRKKKETVYNLLFRSGIKSSLVNLLTVLRILIAPVLIIMLLKEMAAFKWILLIAFLTDALDGFLARRWKVTTKLGSRLDSMADDILFIVSMVAVIYYQSAFLSGHIFVIGCIIFMFMMKIFILWYKHYRFISAMHTYLSKTAAFLQAIFFLHCIFFQPSSFLFHATAIITMIAIGEETIIILAFRELKQNIKGLFFFKSQM